MKLKLFNKEIEIHDHHCHFNDVVSPEIKDKYVNLYVRLTDDCQAKCFFCEFHNKQPHVSFDPYKFLYTLQKILKEIKVNKISFTGGEPTLKIDTLNFLLKEIKSIDKSIFTVVNTNGFLLEKIDAEYVDSIALSRHHWNNSMNFGLFGGCTSLPSYKQIKNYEHKEKLHLSCNLIRGFIDSTERCYEYIKNFGEIGITDIGFVSLMPVNEWAKDHFVDFDEIDLGSMPDTLRNMDWSRKIKGETVCKCANFLTSLDDGTFVKSYARYYVSRNECKGMLVYEPDGKLKTGFNGEVINE